MRRLLILLSALTLLPALFLLLALILVGCAAKQTNSMAPGPAAPSPAAPPDQRPVKTPVLSVTREGNDLHLHGIPGDAWVDWSPSGRTALILEGASAVSRLSVESMVLERISGQSAINPLGWSGPDAQLLFKADAGVSTIGELSLLTGEWHPLATTTVGHPQFCRNGDSWLWVDVREIRQGGAGEREIGPVYRAPAPNPASGDVVKPLGGTQLLERGALLGRLADGSCLLDGMDQRLLLVRPDGKLASLGTGWSLPQVTGDGRGIVWLEEAGNCPECYELGPGVPFRRLIWYRSDGKRLVADLGRPQVIDYLLSGDGERLFIGHRDFQGNAGAISVLGADGFHPGRERAPALIPVGWMGPDLLAQTAGPERWHDKSPVFRAEDGVKVGERLDNGVGGSLLLQMDGEVRYLTPGGVSLRPSRPEQFRDGTVGLGIYQPQASYVRAPQTDGLLLVRMDAW